MNPFRFFVYALMSLSVFLFACENPTEPRPGIPSHPDSVQHHISRSNHQSLYQGTIAYRHTHTVDASFSRSVTVTDVPDAPALFISDDLTLPPNTEGTFTLSVSQAPLEPVTVTSEAADLEIAPRTITFTPEDWAPRVVTVTPKGTTTAEITFTAVGGLQQSETRRITVQEGPISLRISVTGNVSLAPQSTQTLTISLDRDPGAEQIALEIEHLGDVDSIQVTPKSLPVLRHDDWGPRVLTVIHTGKDANDGASIRLQATGRIATQASAQLDQKHFQATITGQEQFGSTTYSFSATGSVQSTGRFLAHGTDFVSPFTESCGVTETQDSRIRFIKNGMTIEQSFESAVCPSLKVQATLIELK